jgi:hypothetical protein
MSKAAFGTLQKPLTLPQKSEEISSSPSFETCSTHITLLVISILLVIIGAVALKHPAMNLADTGSWILIGIGLSLFAVTTVLGSLKYCARSSIKNAHIEEIAMQMHKSSFDLQKSTYRTDDPAT